MKLPEPQSPQFSRLMGDIESGRIKIPQFQRDFVWSKESSAKLLDSIVKGYPIGTFIFWKTKEELRWVRNIGNLELPPTPKGDYINYVLDGQQRLTSLFTILNGLTIHRDDYDEDYSEFYIDLDAKEDEPVVVPAGAETGKHRLIKLHALLHGKIKELAKYPEDIQEVIEEYKNRINAYQFSAVAIEEAPIDVATEIFTRLNVGGKPLTVFEIMVAKTFDSQRDFDLAEKFDELVADLRTVDYDTIPGSTVLQTVSMLLSRECRKKDILKLKKNDIIDIWPTACEAIRRSVDYFHDYYRIPVSRLLPYPSFIVPFSYYFFHHPDKPVGEHQEYLRDFFWRCSLGGRYSSSVESKLAQDIRKIDDILAGNLPKYEWAIDVSPKFIRDNGWFAVGRSYIKSLLCLLAYHQPKSFIDNSIVRIGNDWLKRANSRNYHHFFPKDYMSKNQKEVDAFFVNHIVNITIVDDFLNKRKIKTKAPSKYMREFAKMNKEIDKCMQTHLIKLDSFGVFQDDYALFFEKRCKWFSRELKKRVIEQDIDRELEAVSAEETEEDELETVAW